MEDGSRDLPSEEYVEGHKELSGHREHSARKFGLALKAHLKQKRTEEATRRMLIARYDKWWALRFRRHKIKQRLEQSKEPQQPGFSTFIRTLTDTDATREKRARELEYSQKRDALRIHQLSNKIQRVLNGKK
jgi:hypothetical protein